MISLGGNPKNEGNHRLPASRAVFLDRDGVINEDAGFEKRDITLMAKAPEAIRILNNLGFLVIVVTNQPQVARGVHTEDEVNKINDKLISDLSAEGARIDAIYYCPHHPEKHHPDIPEHCMKYRIECECRKPKPGCCLKPRKNSA